VDGVPADFGRSLREADFVIFATAMERARVPLVIGVVAVCGAALGGCMSPTYGTGKTANQQLVEDLTGILSLGPKERPKIDYKPRPDLVKPETTAVLPPPQDDVTTASSAAWPESPEQRLARIRAEATANRDNPLYRPSVQVDHPGSASTTPAQSAQVRQALAENNGAVSRRKYLSEPPLVYREPSATAPVGELGEDEWKKERSAKREARAESGKRRSWWPW
jgi:hypothetical protein